MSRIVPNIDTDPIKDYIRFNPGVSNIQNSLSVYRSNTTDSLVYTDNTDTRYNLLQPIPSYTNDYTIFLDGTFSGGDENGTKERPWSTFDAFYADFITRPNGNYLLEVYSSNYTSAVPFIEWPMGNRSLSATSRIANGTTFDFDIHFTGVAGQSNNFQINSIALTQTITTDLSALTPADFYSITWINAFIANHIYTGTASNVPGLGSYIEEGVGSLTLLSGKLSLESVFLIGPTITVDGATSELYVSSASNVGANITITNGGTVHMSNLVWSNIIPFITGTTFNDKLYTDSYSNRCGHSGDLTVHVLDRPETRTIVLQFINEILPSNTEILWVDNSTINIDTRCWLAPGVKDGQKIKISSIGIETVWFDVLGSNIDLTSSGGNRKLNNNKSFHSFIWSSTLSLWITAGQYLVS